MKLSMGKCPASAVLEGYPSTNVTLSLFSFLHSHSSVGMCTDILLGTGTLGPANGLSSDGLELSMSGT